MRIAAGPRDAKAEFPGNAGKGGKKSTETAADRPRLWRFLPISKCLHTSAAQPTIRNRDSSVNVWESGLCLDFQTAETHEMSNHDRQKPGETPNQRKSKRSKTAAQQPGTRPRLEPELTNAARELTDNGVTSVEAAVSEAVSEAASAAMV